MIKLAFHTIFWNLGALSDLFRHLRKSAFLLCVSIGFLLYRIALSQIHLGSKLFTGDERFWLSSNGSFALRFFNRSDEPNYYSLGIRFNSVSIPSSEQTVVWVAGNDISVYHKSYLQLTENGELTLFDIFKGVPVWTSKTSQFSVVSGVLHDNGNLVLLNQNNDIVWQSFDTPCDTLLPGQSLTVFKTLRPESKNSIASYYTLFMSDSGQLLLRWESNVIYWSSGISSGSNLSAFLTSNGALRILDPKLKPVWSVYGEDHNDHVNFRFLRLDSDGNLRLYSWVEDSQSWKSVWQAVENQCKVFATCGEHGICVLDESGFSYCKCPFTVTVDSNPKCLAPYEKQCKSGSNMFTYEHTYLYGMYPPNDSLLQTSLHKCESLCLENPDCTASTYTNDGSGKCLIKKTMYITGYSDPSQTSISFLKKCLDPLAVDPTFNLSISSSVHSSVKEPYRLCLPCLIWATLGTILVFVTIHLGIGYLIYQRRKRGKKEAVLAFICPNSKGLIVLTYTEIEDFTGNFKHQIGPKMFKGVLPDNQPVAVKDLKVTTEERKFRAEVSKIATIHHKNLVKLEGYCCELNHRFLIFEYAKNGSVGKVVEDSKLSKRLTWRKRLDICISVARAVCYLHTGCREFVAHGNLKCGNVVLNENFEAKVTEFGLMNVYSEGSSYRASAEKDVEDFGKMILILLSGRQEADDLSEWSYKQWMEGRADNVLDKRIDSGADSEELERVLRVAFWCIQSDERMRPSMGEVVKVLEGTLNVDSPPPPFACLKSAMEGESSKSGSES